MPRIIAYSLLGVFSVNKITTVTGCGDAVPHPRCVWMVLFHLLRILPYLLASFHLSTLCRGLRVHLCSSQSLLCKLMVHWVPWTLRPPTSIRRIFLLALLSFPPRPSRCLHGVKFTSFVSLLFGISLYFIPIAQCAWNGDLQSLDWMLLFYSC